MHHELAERGKLIRHGLGKKGWQETGFQVQRPDCPRFTRSALSYNPQKMMRLAETLVHQTIFCKAVWDIPKARCWWKAVVGH
jgi:hypothetical protein